MLGSEPSYRMRLLPGDFVLPRTKLALLETRELHNQRHTLAYDRKNIPQTILQSKLPPLCLSI